MAELQDREIKIVHAMHVLLNPELREVPWEIKLRTIQAQLLVHGLEWNEDEMTDLVNAINQELKDTIASAMKNLGKYQHLLKNFKKFPN